MQEMLAKLNQLPLLPAIELKYLRLAANIAANRFHWDINIFPDIFTAALKEKQVPAEFIKPLNEFFQSYAHFVPILNDWANSIHQAWNEHYESPAGTDYFLLLTIGLLLDYELKILDQLIRKVKALANVIYQDECGLRMITLQSALVAKRFMLSCGLTPPTEEDQKLQRKVHPVVEKIKWQPLINQLAIINAKYKEKFDQPIGEKLQKNYPAFFKRPFVNKMSECYFFVSELDAILQKQADPSQKLYEFNQHFSLHRKKFRQPDMKDYVQEIKQLFNTLTLRSLNSDYQPLPTESRALSF